MADDTLPESYVRFMAEAREAYADIARRIEAGDVPAGRTAKVAITVPREVVDLMRFEMLASLAENHG